MTPRMARERRMSAASRSNGAARRSRKAAYFVVCVGGLRISVDEMDGDWNRSQAILPTLICIRVFPWPSHEPHFLHAPSLDNAGDGSGGLLLLSSSPHGAAGGLALPALLRRPLLLALRKRKGTTHGAAASLR